MLFDRNCVKVEAWGPRNFVAHYHLCEIKCPFLRLIMQFLRLLMQIIHMTGGNGDSTARGVCRSVDCPHTPAARGARSRVVELYRRDLVSSRGWAILWQSAVPSKQFLIDD